MRKIVLASNNAGKIREFSQIFSDYRIEIVPQGYLGLASVAEIGLSFVENALIKARYAAAQTGFAALADDSGLEVDALGGDPGIFSARFAGIKATDAQNTALLLQKLQGIPLEKRTARYRCVIAYMRHVHDPMPIIAQGTWEGVIAVEPRGMGGFGYDPVFWLPEQQCTVAELAAEIKNTLSHRGQALAGFKREFEKNPKSFLI